MYDSLDPKLVLTALQEAMDTCRPWPPALKSWIKDLVAHSIKSSIGEYKGRYFKQKKGLPTDGSLIVEVANITVCYVLKKVLYEDKSLMKNIVAIKRYIDDGVGIHTMTKRTFDSWRNKISSKVLNFGGLKIKDDDWNVPVDKFGPVNFLDINFWLD